jgi:hypothetical protein
MIVRKIQKEVGPSSTDQEAPNINQVWTVPLEFVFVIAIIWLGQKLGREQDGLKG